MAAAAAAAAVAAAKEVRGHYSALPPLHGERATGGMNTTTSASAVRVPRVKSLKMKMSFVSWKQR